MKRNFLFLCICLIVTSCSTTFPYEFQNRPYAPKSGKGIFICSVKGVKYGLLTMPSPSYYFRPAGQTDESENNIFRTWNIKKNEIEQGEYGYLAIYELPVGKYEMFKWNLFFNKGIIQYDKQPAQEFSIPFEVKEDHLNYIGELSIADYVMRIKDQRERDISLAIEREPTLSNLPVVVPEMHCVSGCSREIKKANDFFFMPIF